MENQPTFEIALAMAGAISAGAYSGGVFDFLCEALSEWERAKTGANAADVPQHNVCIRAMSGASAGALTGAVGLLALSKGVRTLDPTIPPNERYTLPSLYEAWVAKVDLESKDHPDLLGLNDLNATDPVTGKKLPLASVLDSTVLDWIANSVIAAAPPQSASPPPFSWIGKPLHLYMMVTNLRGIPYGVPFHSGAGTDYHVMQSHGDRVHYTVTDLGKTEGENDWAKNDPNDGAFALAALKPPASDAYVSGALASSAFPIALAARKIIALAKPYMSRKWPSLAMPIQPRWPDGYDPTPTVQLNYQAPDGGIIDNEPFEYAHRSIMDGDRPNAAGADTANRAVIMIDPFPEPPDFDTAPDVPPPSLLGIPGALISALKNQARFKPDEVEQAADPQHYSRYLIAPRVVDSDKVSSASLATGLLGGFGGFLDRSFRDYDYQLGRRNCQRFLQEYFTVGEQNPIAFAGGKPLWPAAAYQTQRDAAGKEVRVIPLYGSAAQPVVLLPRPRIGLARVDAIRAKLKSRVNAVIGRIFSENIGSSIARGLLNVVWLFARGPVLDDTVRWVLLKGLIEADQLTELASTDANGQSKGDVARAVLVVAAALCDTGFDYYTRAALMAVLDGKPGQTLSRHLDAAVAALKTQPFFDVWNGSVDGYPDCFAWAERRPSWAVRQVSQAPKVKDPDAQASKKPAR